LNIRDPFVHDWSCAGTRLVVHDVQIGIWQSASLKQNALLQGVLLCLLLLLFLKFLDLFV
jgi:hypothetical protein